MIYRLYHVATVYTSVKYNAFEFASKQKQILVLAIKEMAYSMHVIGLEH